MQFISAAMATLALVLMFTAAHAADPGPGQETFEDRLADSATALQLTDDQRDAFARVLAERVQAQRAVLERYGVDPDNAVDGLAALGRADRRKLRGDMAALRAETTDALAKILDEAQLETYAALEAERQDAQREAIRERMRTRF